MSKFITAACIAAFVMLVALAPTAGAHVTPVEPTGPAGGYSTVELQVPHGCDGAATEQVAVQLRDDLTSVKAQAVPGWKVSYERAPLDEPIEVHGNPVTEYISVVTWTATDTPLPDDQFQRFGISMKLPDAEGETLMFPTVQTCVDGSTASWIEADPDGDEPAPMVELVASGGDGHGGGDDSTDDVGEVVDAELAASTSDDSGSASNTVALVLAVTAVLLAGGALFVSLSRRSS